MSGLLGTLVADLINNTKPTEICLATSRDTPKQETKFLLNFLAENKSQSFTTVTLLAELKKEFPNTTCNLAGINKRLHYYKGTKVRTNQVRDITKNTYWGI